MPFGYRRYCARPTRVQARQAFDRTIVVTAEGVVYALKGDWIIVDGNTITVMSNEHFQRTYELDTGFLETSVSRRGLR